MGSCSKKVTKDFRPFCEQCFSRVLAVEKRMMVPVPLFWEADPM